MSRVFVYVVFGQCGSYEDQSCWPIVAYPDRRTAHSHAIRAWRRADRLREEYERAMDAALADDGTDMDGTDMPDHTTFVRRNGLDRGAPDFAESYFVSRVQLKGFRRA